MSALFLTFLSVINLQKNLEIKNPLSYSPLI